MKYDCYLIFHRNLCFPEGNKQIFISDKAHFKVFKKFVQIETKNLWKSINKNFIKKSI